MPDREFVHCSNDVAGTLRFVLDSGFHVMVDEPQDGPAVRMLSYKEASVATKGQFLLMRPNWVFGSFQTMEITAGYNRGRYFVKPRVNFAAIAISFQGERVDAGRRRFGHAGVSSYRDWLELPAKVVREAPPETGEWFKRIVAHLSSGVVVKAGVHKYHISKGVLADPEAGNCLPPFDFIPWGPGVLHAPQSKKTSARKT